MINNKALQLIKKHEGLKLKPYRCSEGKLTIGYGRNLEDVGIKEKEALIMLINDTEDATDECIKLFPNFALFNKTRQAVLINMMFNLGASRFYNFQRMRKALSLFDYEEAAIEMLDSRWADQVGNRAIELANIMVDG